LAASWSVKNAGKNFGMKIVWFAALRAPEALALVANKRVYDRKLPLSLKLCIDRSTDHRVKGWY
jgi:hypothetical protein